MDIFFKILWAVLIFGFGGCLGAFITLKYLEKTTDELMVSYNNIIKVLKAQVAMDKEVIEQLLPKEIVTDRGPITAEKNRV